MQAVFDLSRVTTAKEVKGKTLFENRAVAVSRGLLRDSFQPYQRHVYELDWTKK